MEGTLVPGGIAEVLKGIIAEGRSGLLFLRSGEREKGLYFDRGAMVHAESNQRVESLAHYFLEHDLVALDQLEQALGEVGPGHSLEAALLQHQAVDPDQLSEAKKAVMMTIVTSAFEWSAGSYLFQEGDFPYHREDALMPTLTLVAEGVRRMYDFDAIRDRLLASTRPLGASTAAEHDPARLHLGPTEGFIMSRVDGASTTREICSVSLLSEEMTCRILYALMVAGVVSEGGQGTNPRPQAKPDPRPTAPLSTRPPEMQAAYRKESVRLDPPRDAPAPQPARATPQAGARPASNAAGANRAASRLGLTPDQIRRVEEIERLFEAVNAMSHYAILGLEREASVPAVQAAFDGMSARFHPRNNAFIHDDALRSKLVYVFGKILNAHKTLSDPRTRDPYDDHLRREERERTADVTVRMDVSKSERQKAIDERSHEAEGHYKTAQLYFNNQRFHDALEAVKKAIKVYPEEARYFALAGTIEGKNPILRWQKDAEVHLVKAQELDPWNPEYALELGKLYNNAGLKTKAKRQYYRVLKLDPQNTVALAEVPPAERPRQTIEKPAEPAKPVADEEDPEVEVS